MVNPVFSQVKVFPLTASLLNELVRLSVPLSVGGGGNILLPPRVGGDSEGRGQGAGSLSFISFIRLSVPKFISLL